MLIQDTRRVRDRHSELWLGHKVGLDMISKDSPLSYIEDHCHLQMLKLHLETSVRLGVWDSDITRWLVGIRGFIKLVWTAYSRDPLLYGVNDSGWSSRYGIRSMTLEHERTHYSVSPTRLLINCTRSLRSSSLDFFSFFFSFSPYTHFLRVWYSKLLRLLNCAFSSLPSNFDVIQFAWHMGLR